MARADFLVIGGGVAGISAAAELSELGKVIVLEREDAPAYHSTGRSAAAFVSSYGNAQIRALSAIAEPFFRSPPPGFTQVPLLIPRAMMLIARADQASGFAKHVSVSPQSTVISPEQAERLAPGLRPGYTAHALLDETCGDLDVDAIVQGYARLLRSRGGRIQTNADVLAFSANGRGWTVSTQDETFEAPVVVNAAGAWAEQIGALAGLPPLGLTPLRRTAVIVDPPTGMDVGDWPMVIDSDETFYFKPEAGKLLVSPADETPSAPCDAQADEYDVAVAVDRFQSATTIEVRRINHRWAGLRTFAPDRTLVVGFDPAKAGFFWLAGQGGYGVQTAPAVSRLVRDLVGESEFDDQTRSLVDALSPGRPALRGASTAP